MSRATGASSRYLYFGSIGSPSAPESIERCSWVKVTPKLAGSMGPNTIGKIQASHVRSYKCLKNKVIDNKTDSTE